ncbi:uncharacterized protein LOC102612806 [Citrus sinensis]|uniref:uncharacterized protein LOC102612806 n=1 Tax=Citrus sinensis TaxID=2711 RepID=UPI0003D77D0A|nr:uncharacterized protein LOC102612806 [Citrus sinensis]
METASEYRRVSLAKLVDGLLWISPHMENLSIKYDLYCWKYKLSFQEKHILMYKIISSEVERSWRKLTIFGDLCVCDESDDSDENSIYLCIKTLRTETYCRRLMISGDLCKFMV